MLSKLMNDFRTLNHVILITVSFYLAAMVQYIYVAIADWRAIIHHRNIPDHSLLPALISFIILYGLLVVGVMLYNKTREVK